MIESTEKYYKRITPFATFFIALQLAASEENWTLKKKNLRTAEAGSIKTSNIIYLNDNASGDYGVGSHPALDMNSTDFILVDKEW